MNEPAAGSPERASRSTHTGIFAELPADRDAATNEVLPLVYSELRRLAASQLSRERKQHTLQPTALVHEAYLRLVGSPTDECWKNRSHFFGAAAEAMRRILVDHARARARLKRQAPEPVPQADEASSAPQEFDDLLALDDALGKLHEADAGKAELVKLKFFGGLTTAQAAEALGLSLRTAEREWAFARVWLHREIEGSGE